MRMMPAVRHGPFLSSSARRKGKEWRMAVHSMGAMAVVIDGAGGAVSIVFALVLVIAAEVSNRTSAHFVGIWCRDSAMRTRDSGSYNLLTIRLAIAMLKNRQD